MPVELMYPTAPKSSSSGSSPGIAV